MKLVKLDHRHSLKRKGYAYAFRFEHWESEASKVESTVRRHEKSGYDFTFWSKKAVLNSKGYSSRPYWIGIRNESTVSMVLLSMEN